MRKSGGSNIEPCGTPARIDAQSESWPLRTTLWRLSSRKLRNLEGFLIYQEIQVCIAIICAILYHPTSTDGLWSKSG